MKIRSVQLINIRCFADTGELPLEQINVLVGRNNSGKSTIIRGIHALQSGGPQDFGRQVRVGEASGAIQVKLDDVHERYFPKAPIAALAKRGAGDTSAHISIPSFDSSGYSLRMHDRSVHVMAIANVEPQNFIYSYLSKRKVLGFDEDVDLQRSTVIESNMRNLTARVDVLSNPDHPRFDEYTSLCNALLGYRVTALTSHHGKRMGIQIGLHDRIYVESMGEGVSSLLGLITSLCMSDGNLYLIEEPENDIHPEGLKRLLAAIVEKSESNQFVLSTHSDIVTRYLGSAPNSRVYEVGMSYSKGEVPTSEVSEVDKAPEARMAVLRKLGYELYDLDLWAGWLILEEASAEVIIRDYLIPWFAPRLSRVRTLSARGTGNVEATFEDFHRLFLFTHLEPMYRERSWVLVDGDESGQAVVANLRSRFRTWPAAHFECFEKANFEEFYPTRFKDDVVSALSLPHDRRSTAKIKLLKTVKDWCDASPVEARADFASSAANVIARLQDIEAVMFDVDAT